ncbi:T9SS type A sorting domain-containing protein [bacterium]|nr:T9SS type A sorting domain-containing protein [bacterium]
MDLEDYLESTNPFNPTTRIEFDIPADIVDRVQVQLLIYNILGERVRTLVDESRFAGSYFVEWDARNDHGVRLSTGIYIYQLIAGDFKQTKRMLLLK